MNDKKERSMKTYYIYRIEDGTRYGVGTLINKVEGLRAAKYFTKLYRAENTTKALYQLRDKKGNILL